MAKLKTYQSTYQTRSMYINIDGSYKRLSFTGGTSQNGGRLTTQDEVIQNALEAHPEFKSGQIFIVGEYPIETAVSGKRQAVSKESPELDTSITPSNQTGSTDVVFREDVTTTQKAHSVLVNEYKVTPASKKKVDVIAKAEEVGVRFNI